MAEIWASLLPILLADVVNPVLFAFMVYAAGTGRPVVNSTAVLIGHTVAYLAAGITLSFALESVSERLANPKRIDFVVEFLVALALLWLAFRSASADEREPGEKSQQLTPVSAFGAGVIINFVGIPFAVPYFAALSQVLKADLNFHESLAVLLAYNVLYALPFITIPILVVIMGDRSQAVLARITVMLTKASGFLMPILLALVALLMLADSVSYFLSGQPLF